MAEGVMGSTVAVAEKHPWWILGGLGGLVLLLWMLSGSKAPAGQNFSFSYGPSDSQIKAGTALAISQAADQTAVSMANIQSADTRSYFDLISNTTANSNAAKVSTASIAANTALGITNLNTKRDVSVAGIASNTALGTAGYAVQTAGIQAGRDTTIAGINANRDVQGFAYSAQTSQYAAGLDANTKSYASQLNYLGLVNTNQTNLAASTSNNYTSGVLATINANRDMYIARGSLYGQ